MTHQDLENLTDDTLTELEVTIDYLPDYQKAYVLQRLSEWINEQSKLISD